MSNVNFAIPEIYGDSLSYYEVLRELITAMNVIIDNYDTIPEQIADAVKNLDAAQLFSAVLEQLIDTIATDNTKSANAVKVYKKHDLLYATFNDTVNLYESLIDFSTGTETELIVGSNIREVNISEMFIELRKLIDGESQTREQTDTALQNAINNEKSSRERADTTLRKNINDEKSAREQADTNLQQNINAEESAREQADTALQTKIDNGTLKIDELWKNNDTSSSFASQTVHISTTGYKLLYILFKNYTFYGEFGEIILPTNNSGVYYGLSVNTNNKGNIMSRGVSIVSSGVKFEDAFVGNSTDNKAMLPFKIYGIK